MLVVVEKEMGSYPIEGLFGSISLCQNTHTSEYSPLAAPSFLPSLLSFPVVSLFPFFPSPLLLSPASPHLPHFFLLPLYMAVLPPLPPTPPHTLPSLTLSSLPLSFTLPSLPSNSPTHTYTSPPLHRSPLLLLSLPFQHHSLFSASSSPATADILERLLLTQ